MNVTDEMVEAARTAFGDAFEKSPPNETIGEFRTRIIRSALEAALSAPAQRVEEGWKQEDVERESEAFHRWWNDNGYDAYPDLYTQTCQNAMLSAWQEVSKRASLAASPAPAPHAGVDASLIERIDDLERRLAAAEQQKVPRCAECHGDGQVSRSFGFVPCSACDGRGL